MTQTIDAPAASTLAPIHRPVWMRAWRVVAWVLLAGWIVAIAIALSLGRQDATPGDLRNDVFSGEVEEVAVDGGIHPGLEGRVTVAWRTGPLSSYEALVPVRQVEALGVRVVDTELPSSGVSLFDRSIAGGTAPLLAGLALWLGTIGVLALSPVLWRGTAAGWAWPVLLLPPYGPVAYLLLGGPTGVLRPTARTFRLTGWLSFLLCVLAGPTP